MNGSSLRFLIRTETDAMRSVISASHFAEQLGLSKQDCQAISTSVSELARNILKYAGRGEVLVQALRSDRGEGVQITARDRGPGIEDIEAAMQDHFSSSGTLGLGLPGVRRLMDEFELESEPGQGTRVVVRKWTKPPNPMPRKTPTTKAKATAPSHRPPRKEIVSRGEENRKEGVDYSFYVRPCRGERVSGDLVVVRSDEDQVFLAIIDALGHGRSAHAIARQAANYLRENWTTDLEKTMASLHEELSATDGAAAGLCVVEQGTGRARYVGVGNTMVRQFGSEPGRAFSVPGTLGHQIRKPKTQCLSLHEGDLLMMYTDGVKEQFELEDYPQLRYQSAREIARTVVTRYGKDHDDASCVVLRYGA